MSVISCVNLIVGIQPALTSPSSLQLVPVTRIEKKIVTNGAVSAHEGKMSQTLGNDRVTES